MWADRGERSERASSSGAGSPNVSRPVLGPPLSPLQHPHDEAVYGVGLQLAPTRSGGDDGGGGGGGGDKGGIKILGLASGCAAEKSGKIHVGDEVVSVNGSMMHDLASARSALLGRQGSFVTVGISPKTGGGGVREVKLLRGSGDFVGLHYKAEALAEANARLQKRNLELEEEVKRLSALDQERVTAKLRVGEMEKAIKDMKSAQNMEKATPGLMASKLSDALFELATLRAENTRLQQQSHPMSRLPVPYISSPSNDGASFASSSTPAGNRGDTPTRTPPTARTSPGSFLAGSGSAQPVVPYQAMGGGTVMAGSGAGVGERRIVNVSLHHASIVQNTGATHPATGAFGASPSILSISQSDQRNKPWLTGGAQSLSTSTSSLGGGGYGGVEGESMRRVVYVPLNVSLSGSGVFPRTTATPLESPNLGALGAHSLSSSLSTSHSFVPALNLPLAAIHNSNHREVGLNSARSPPDTDRSFGSNYPFSARTHFMSPLSTERSHQSTGDGGSSSIRYMNATSSYTNATSSYTLGTPSGAGSSAYTRPAASGTPGRGGEVVGLERGAVVHGSPQYVPSQSRFSQRISPYVSSPSAEAAQRYRGGAVQQHQQHGIMSPARDGQRVGAIAASREALEEGGTMFGSQKSLGDFALSSLTRRTENGRGEEMLC